MSKHSPDINEYTLCYYISNEIFTMYDNIEIERDELKELPAFSGRFLPILFLYFDKSKNISLNNSINIPLNPSDLPLYFLNMGKHIVCGNFNQQQINEYLGKKISEIGFNKLNKLLNRYFVEGYQKFCIKIITLNINEVPYYEFFHIPQLYHDYAFHIYDINIYKKSVLHFFQIIQETIMNKFDNKYLNENKYEEFCNLLYNLNRQCIFHSNKIDVDLCQQLNSMEKELNKENDILSDFLKIYTESIILKLISEKVISRCKFCNSIMSYRQHKKYCSQKYEGRDCGKKARNKKSYEKYRNTRKDMQKPKSQERRDWYKSGNMKIN